MKHDYSIFGWVLWGIGLGIAIFALVYVCWGLTAMVAIYMSPTK